MKTLNKKIFRLLILISLIVVIGVSFIVTSAIYKGAHSGAGSIILDKGINIEFSDANIDNLSRNMSIPVQYYTDKSATSEENRKDFSVEPTSSTEYYIANPTITAQAGTEPFYLRVKLNTQYYADGSDTPTTFSMSLTEKQILYSLFSTDSNYSPIKFNDYFAADANGEYYYYVSGGYGAATKNNLQLVNAGDEIKLFQGFLANDVTPVSSVYFKYFESIPNNVTKISFTLDIELATAQIWDMPDVKLLTEDEITLSGDKTEIIAINAVDTTYALPGYTTDGTKITSVGVSTNMLDGDAVKVYFANTMTTVGGYNSVSSLNKIYLGNNVTTIAPNAFSYSGLTGDLILPITIANIGENAFNNCDFACEFPYIPNIAAIGDYAFNSCDGLIGTLHISGSVGNNAFENTGFDVIKITSGATSLGQGSLSNLTSLLRVYIDSSSISSLDSSNCGLLSNNTLTDVYVKEGLAVGEYISNNANFVLTKSNVSGYNHYGRAVKITWNGGSIAGTLDANLWNYAGSTGYTSTNAGSNSVYTFSGKNAISKVGINGENIYYLPTPIISGYTFNGWFTADGAGVKVATADGWIASVSGYTDENKAWIKTDATTLYARYTKKSFTISYNLAGGGTSSTRPTSYTFGTTTSIPNPTRTGYTFLGWTVSSSLTGKTYGTINLGDGHQQFDSNYTSAVYYELYYLNNNITYTGELSDSEIRWRMYTTAGAYNGSLSSTPVTPSSDGYTSLWYHRGKSASNTTISFTTGTSYSVDAHQVGDLTLTARWKANTYTVTFNPNGGTVSQTSTTVTYDSTYGTLPTPTRTGYTFEGWFTAKSDGTHITSGTKVAITSAQTLYAHWTANKYTVTFDPNGGSVSQTTKSVTYDAAYSTLPTPTKTVTGYTVTFKGWYTASSGGTKVTADTVVSTAGNHTLYAQWEQKANTYTVTFNPNGGSVSQTSKSVTYGSTYGTLPTPTKTVTGYTVTFKGWYTAASGGTKITSTTSVSTSSNHTLYAQWTQTANKYTVSFNANGGSVDTASKNVTYNSTYGTLPTPTRTGYTFNGWFTAASGGTKIVDTTKVTTANNHTLYAQWTANNYTVTFNANGGSVSTTSKSVTYGSTYGTLPTPTKTVTGYTVTFKGWYTAASGGTKVTADTVVATAGNHTLYAQWEQTANTYTVTFNANGGSVSPDTKSVTYASTYGTLPTPTAPTEAGYSFTFNGWFTAASGGTKITETTKVTTASGHTLYAQWTKTANQYTVEFNPNQKGGLMTDVANGTYTGNNATITYTSAGHQYKFVNSSSSDPYATIEATVYLVANTTYTMHAKLYDANGVALTSGSIQIFYAINGAYSESNSKRISASGGSVTFTVSTTGTYKIRLDNDCGQTILIKEFYITNEFTTSKNVAYDSAYGTLPTPTRENYTFEGWFTAASGGTQITSDTIVKITSTQTLYAHWTLNKSYLLTGSKWQQALIDANSNYTQANIANITFTNTKPTSGTVVSVGATSADGTTAYVEGTRYISDVKAYVTSSSTSGKYNVTFYSPVTIYAPINSSDLFSNSSTSSRLTSLTSITFNNFNTSNVTNMSSMFYYCSGLTSLNLSTFNMSATTNVSNMLTGVGSEFDFYELITPKAMKTSITLPFHFCLASDYSGDYTSIPTSLTSTKLLPKNVQVTRSDSGDWSKGSLSTSISGFAHGQTITVARGTYIDLYLNAKGNAFDKSYVYVAFNQLASAPTVVSGPSGNTAAWGIYNRDGTNANSIIKEGGLTIGITDDRTNVEEIELENNLILESKENGIMPAWFTVANYWCQLVCKSTVAMSTSVTIRIRLTDNTTYIYGRAGSGGGYSSIQD